MGQKVHPYSLRLGIFYDWKSRWFAHKKTYRRFLIEDIRLRDFIKAKLYRASIARIEIERTGENKVKVDIYTAKPGLIIGRRGADIEKLQAELESLTDKNVSINIKEVKEMNLDAQLVAENIALQIEKRAAYRRVMKRAVQLAMDAGALGIKVRCAGRLGGAEMARREGYKEGKVPLQTIRANIDYGFCGAKTTYGVIGVKVWIYKGEMAYALNAQKG